MASHIVSLYLALLNFTNFSRRTPSTLRKIETKTTVRTNTRPPSNCLAQSTADTHTDDVLISPRFGIVAQS